MKRLIYAGLSLALLAIFAIDAAASSMIPKYEQFVLSNGFRVVAWEDHEQPMVSFSFLVKSGTSSDSANLSGLSSLTAYMVKEGSTKFPGTHLAAAIDSIGGTLTIISNDRDGIFYEGDFLSRDLPFAMELMGEMIIHPTFPEEALERLRRRLVSANLQYKSVPEILMSEALYRGFYGDRGYGLPPMGKISTLNRITLENVRNFYDNNYRPNNCILVIAGDFSLLTLKKLVGDAFSSWSHNGKSLEVSSAFKLPDSVRIVLIDNPGSLSAEFAIGRPIIPASSSDFPSLVLLNYMLGAGGRISRLYQNLIANNGVATYLTSSLNWSRGNGMLIVSGSATNEAVPDAIRQVKSVFDDLRNIRVPVRELEGAKYYYQGYWPSLYETPGGATHQFALLVSRDVGIGFHEKVISECTKVDPNKIRQAALNYLDYNHCLIVVYGAESALKIPLSQWAPVEVIKPGQ